MQHTDWNDLSQAVRDLVQARTGPVLAARTVSAGLNSHFAAVLETVDGLLFVKGVRTDHPGFVRQHREAMINPNPQPWKKRFAAVAQGWAEYRSGKDSVPPSPKLPLPRTAFLHFPADAAPLSRRRKLPA